MPTDGGYITQTEVRNSAQSREPTVINHAVDANGTYYYLLVNVTGQLELWTATTTTWSEVKNFGTIYASGNFAGFYLAIEAPETIHVAYVDSSQNVLYGKSTDAGATWTVDGEDSGYNVGSSEGVVGCHVYGGNVYVFVANPRTGGATIKGYKRTSGGSWSNPGDLSRTNMWHPVSSSYFYGVNGIVLFCMTNSSNRSIIYRATYDMTSDSWSSVTTMTGNSHYYQIPQPLVDVNGDFHFIFGGDEQNGYNREAHYTAVIGGTQTGWMTLWDANGSYHGWVGLGIDTDGNIYASFFNYGNEWQKNRKSTLSRISVDETDWDAELAYANDGNGESFAGLNQCHYVPGTGGCAVMNSATVNDAWYQETSDFSFDGSAWPGATPSAHSKGILSGGGKLPIAGNIMTGGGL